MLINIDDKEIKKKIKKKIDEMIDSKLDRFRFDVEKCKENILLMKLKIEKLEAENEKDN